MVMRNPRVLYGGMEIYAQNNPRGYGLWVTLFTFGLLLLTLLPVLLVLTDRPLPVLPLLFAFVVPVLVIGGIMVLAMPMLMRRMLGTAVLPPDTDPVHLLEAKRRLRKGGLHENEDVNRVGRILAAQAEGKFRSPKTIYVMGLVGAVLFAGFALSAYLGSGADFDFWFRAVIALFFAVYPFVLAPWVRRYRRRAHEFAEVYDARQRGD